VELNQSIKYINCLRIIKLSSISFLLWRFIVKKDFVFVWRIWYITYKNDFAEKKFC